MTDWRLRASAPGEDPAAVAEREAHHELLRDLLGAYADRELPPETTSRIDAHLVGCARCRRELAMHTTLRRRLEAEPTAAAPSALRERLVAAVAATPVPDAAREPRRWRDALARSPLRVFVGVLALVLVVLVGWAGERHDRAGAAAPLVTTAAATPRVPLVDSVLADYRRATAADLPGRARDLDVVRAAVPFPVDVLHVPGLRLLAAWTTSLGGEPAAVLAYRWDDRVVLEYLVSEGRFFQHPVIRRGVAGGRLLAITDRGQTALAWPTAAAGAFLVGDLSPGRLASLAAHDALARKVVRGAP